ncbi:hypothetical protein SAMN05414139_00237 [Burkholderia sp. D7]|nr:hypothetical protein SAMN05414139_00237 [Burkholderia sp. D7]
MSDLLASLLQADPSQDERTRLSPKVLRIASELQGLDLAGLLVVQGLVGQMTQTTVRHFADLRATTPDLAPEGEAILAGVIEGAGARLDLSLATPRAERAFSVRQHRDTLTREPAMVEALTRGLTDLNALLNSDEFVTLSEAAQICGTSEQTVRTRVKDRKLFSVAGPGSVRSKYPVWQFSSSWGEGVLEALLKAMPAVSGLEVHRFFTTPNPRLAEVSRKEMQDTRPPSPLELLDITRDGSGRTAPKALDAPVVQALCVLARAFAAEGTAAA